MISELSFYVLVSLIFILSIWIHSEPLGSSGQGTGSMCTCYLGLSPPPMKVETETRELYAVNLFGKGISELKSEGTDEGETRNKGKPTQPKVI
jgi:hypothetical protein